VRILVDTSAWLAIQNAKDNNHVPASRCWEEIEASKSRYILSTWIFEETLTLVSRRTHPEAASLLGRMFLDSGRIEIVRGDPGLESRALLLMRSRKEDDFSFTDAASWVIAREHAVDAVFAFDRHLRMPGIRQIPQGLGVAVREEGIPYQTDSGKRMSTRRRKPAGGARRRSTR